MSALIGQMNSLNRQDYVQPSKGKFLAKGNYLAPDRPSALGADDRSRFRPQSFVAPQQIELMNGSFSIPGFTN